MRATRFAVLEPLPYPPVLTKGDFVQRYRLGEFGNAAPTWDTLAAFLKSGYRGLVHLRNRKANGPTWYDVLACDVETQATTLIAKGHDIYFSGMAPTEHTLFQGEVQQSIHHLDLYYSTVRKPMRQSLIEGGKQVRGLEAYCLLRHYLDPSSYEWFEHLLISYPEHVLEFSTYSMKWGTVPNRNTVWWEVRRY